MIARSRPVAAEPRRSRGRPAETTHSTTVDHDAHLRLVQPFRLLVDVVGEALLQLAGRRRGRAGVARVAQVVGGDDHLGKTGQDLPDRVDEVAARPRVGSRREAMNARTGARWSGRSRSSFARAAGSSRLDSWMSVHVESSVSNSPSSPARRLPAGAAGRSADGRKPRCGHWAAASRSRSVSAGQLFRAVARLRKSSSCRRGRRSIAASALSCCCRPSASSRPLRRSSSTPNGARVCFPAGRPRLASEEPACPRSAAPPRGRWPGRHELGLTASQRPSAARDVGGVELAAGDRQHRGPS